MDSLLILNSELTQITLLSIIVRMSLAVLLGGIIGLERGANKQAAGFRTHILVCVGAALAMMTNQYVYEYVSSSTDPVRMAAQVITGVGFLGVGTILVTGKYKIKGLTTAAGLWASACIGLAIGIGFYAGAIAASILVFISLELFIKLEGYVYSRSRVMDIYMELGSVSQIKLISASLREQGIIIHDSHVAKSEIMREQGIGYEISIRLPKGLLRTDLLRSLEENSSIYLIQEF